MTRYYDSDQTRKVIAEKAAQLFSQKGFAGTSNKAFRLAKHDELWVSYQDDSGPVNRRYALNGTNLEQDGNVIATNIEKFALNYMFDNDPNAGKDWQWRASAEDILDPSKNDLGSEAPKNIVEARELIRAVKIVILAGARPSAFNPTDTFVLSSIFYSSQTHAGELGWLLVS